MNVRNQHLKVLREKYFMAKSRKEKSSILNEYLGNTGQNTQYVIRKLKSPISLVTRKIGSLQWLCLGSFSKGLANLRPSLRTKTGTSVKDRAGYIKEV